jgi:mono/diheme cytochrome c family protein
VPARLAKNLNEQVRGAIDHLRRILKAGDCVDVAVYADNCLNSIKSTEVALQHCELSERTGSRRCVAFFDGAVHADRSCDYSRGVCGYNPCEINNAANRSRRKIVAARGGQSRKRYIEVLQARFCFGRHKLAIPRPSKWKNTLAHRRAGISGRDFGLRDAARPLRYRMRRTRRLRTGFGLFLSALLSALLSTLCAIALWEGALFGAEGETLSVARSWTISQAAGPPVHTLPLHMARQASSDLEVGGELMGLTKGATRYMALSDLLKLPQASYTVSTDPNFAKRTTISGVPLEELLRLLSAVPDAAMIVAVCDDKYQAAYPRAYVAAHHPLLVLKVDGQLPSGWPKDPETHSFNMGPYMISQPTFKPSFKILAHSDEAQIPWGVVRLEFRDERAAFKAISPRGPHAQDAAVQAGYRIAQQNCYRCHNMGREGGPKAGRSWAVLGALAFASPDYFSAYVREPKKKNPRAEMPGNPSYDEETIGALRAYFQTFAPPERP